MDAELAIRVHARVEIKITKRSGCNSCCLQSVYIGELK